MKHLFRARYWLCLAALGAIQLFGRSAMAAPPASYPTAEAAAGALVDALKADDQTAIAHVLGDRWRDYIPVDSIDHRDVDAFVQLYDQGHKTVGDSKSVHLAVGRDAWAFPIPIERKSSGWSFDLNRGHDEITARQIGRNELFVAQAMLAYYDAQRDYATDDRNGDGVAEYAQKLISSAGKQDGLYWPSGKAANESPLGPYFAAPPTEQERSDYHGYRFRILLAQGPSAPGGAYDYLNARKQLVNGFALVAWPARYGQSGVMTFMVSHDGQVFEKDLGKTTDATAPGISRFDPDASWSEVDPAD